MPEGRKVRALPEIVKLAAVIRGPGGNNARAVAAGFIRPGPIKTSEIFTIGPSSVPAALRNVCGNRKTSTAALREVYENTVKRNMFRPSDDVGRLILYRQTSIKYDVKFICVRAQRRIFKFFPWGGGSKILFMF